MAIPDAVIPPLAGNAYLVPTAVAPDAGFDARWAAWLARGRAHAQRARRRFVVRAGVLTIGAALVYAFLRS
jgi:hypothetical protein